MTTKSIQHPEIQQLRIGEICKLEQGNSPTLKTPPGPYPLVVTAESRRSSETYQFDAVAVGCDRASAKDFHEIRAVFTRGVA